MLNAKEARKIALSSHENVEKILAKLDVQVRDAAGSGKGHVICTEDDTYHVVEAGKPRPEATPLQNRLVTRLKEFGYIVELIKEGPHARSGLGFTGDEPEIEKHYIRIRW